MKIINVKQESIQFFLKENCTRDASKRSCSGEHELTREMNIKKDCNIEIGDRVQFCISDSDNFLGLLLEKTAIFKCEEYDDVSNKLIIEDLKVKKL